MMEMTTFMNKNKDIEWRPIPGYEDRYKCSSDSQIYSLISNTTLKPGVGARGYLQVVLYKDGKRSTRGVHSIVSLVFLGKRPDGMHVNHKDCDKMNNNLENLEYVTPKRNVEHAIENGLRNTLGEKNQSSILSNEDIPAIRKMLSDGKLTRKQIAEKYNVSIATIFNIASGRNWDSVEGGTCLDLGYRPRNDMDENTVREIRRLVASGKYTQQEIANIFNVCRSSISAIKNRKVWRDIK